MRLVTYDCEVFAHDWLVTFKDKDSGEYTLVWNDNDALTACIDDDTIYCGFNNKHYDQHIIKAIAMGYSPEDVKKVNDYIIGGGIGWSCPMLQGAWFQFNNADLKDDTQLGQSLKSIEGHLGLPIRESSVRFDIDRKLTKEERKETEYYCKHDVDTTEMLIDIRKDYLKNKINLGRLAGLGDAKALSMTNAKLTAAMLKAEKHEDRNDERKYVVPDNLLREHVPQEVFEFFEHMYDDSLTDDEVFKMKLKINVGDCPVTIGYGGIHGAIPNYFFEEQDGRIIRNYDVGSYYPHLMTVNGYTSRNIPSAKIYEDVLDRRMKAKADEDKATANALKLVCNTTYGCLLNKYNDLYDPLMGRSVCISGQLYLLELSEHLHEKIPNLKIVQLNTDGVMVEFDDEFYNDVIAITKEWEQRTGFDLEEDKVARIAQKDVNNYVEVQSDGTAKCKGGYLVKGVSNVGAFKVNNSAVIVATAIKEYFVNGTPVEDTINNCDDVFQYQMIAKAGTKYKESYHLIDGEKHPVQRVNRVYATSDERYGKLYKVKAEDDSTAKIDSLPEHCIIDNENAITIDQIDKTFYIEMAKKRVNDFKGIKPEKKTKRRKKMATTKQNVYQKLILAREEFLKSEIEQSGKNMHLSFKYFELKDIVPTITKIFAKTGLLAIMNFTDKTGIVTIINTDNPEETIEFFAPFNQIEPIVSNTGKQATNNMQALGSSITYMRRYLYLIAMDICVNDEIEPTIDKTTNAATTGASKQKPATPAKRTEVKENLTAVEDNASDIQIKGLKNVLKKLKEKDPSKEEMIAKLAIQTNGFKVISKKDCEVLVEKINGMLEG